MLINFISPKSAPQILSLNEEQTLRFLNFCNCSSNQPPKFRTENLVEINDKSRGTFNTGSQIKFKSAMLMSILCDYSDAYIPVKGNIRINNTADANANANNIKQKSNI